MAGKKAKADHVNLLSQDPGLLRLFLIVRLKDRELTVEKVLAELECRGTNGLTASTVRRWLRSFVKEGYVREVAGRPGIVVATAMGRKLATEAGARLKQLVTTTS